MSPSTHSADVSQIQTDTTAILVDTGTTIPGTITTVDANVDAILVDTGTTIPGTITTMQTDTSSILTASNAAASISTEARLAELDAANLPANLDAVLVDTGTTIPATITTMQTDVSEMTDTYLRIGGGQTTDITVSSTTDVTIGLINCVLPAGNFYAVYRVFIFGTVAGDVAELTVTNAGTQVSAAFVEIRAASSGQYVELSASLVVNGTQTILQFNRVSGSGVIHAYGMLQFMFPSQ